MENQRLPILRNLENVFLIDWLSITFHGCKVDEIQSILGMTGVDWSTSVSFINGYPMDTSFGNIHIRWGADDPSFYKDGYDRNGNFRSAADKCNLDMGIQLDMSGQGCRAFEDFSEFTWEQLFERIFRFGGRFSVTRIDLAYDDHSGLLDIWRMRYDVENRHYISKAKKTRFIWSDDHILDIRGLTIEIGSNKSPVLIRIYDKAAERGFDSGRHWIRVELQLRHERAHETLRELFRRESIGLVASGIIRNYCCFCEPGLDSNRSRWPTAEYWQRVLEGMEKIRIWVAPGEEYNFSKAENHLIYQYGQFMQAYFAVHGEFHSMLDRSRKLHPVLNPRYVKIINTERARIERQRESAQIDESYVLPDDPDVYVQANFAELFAEDPDLPDTW